MKHIMLIVFLSLASFSAMAHKPSDSYLALKVEGNQVQGQWDIALRDLDYAIGLDGNDDGHITWTELRERKEAVYAYALNRLEIATNQQNCPLKPTDILVDEHSDGHYAVLNFQADCLADVQKLSITYGLFFDLDAQHRGLLKLTRNERTDTTIFSPDRKQVDFALNSVRKPWQEFLNFAHEGVWHIWIGFDHILFLLSLLLPAALVRENSSWYPKQGFSQAFWEVLAVVTAFTLAHSITLSLAVLGYISLPTRWVESAIAASVVIAALNNVYPIFVRRRSGFAFGFGLIHGMGIASVLLDMGLPNTQGLISLLGFNLGVEVGQLAIVSIAFPIIILFSQYRYYPVLVMKLGSTGIAIVALFWLAERSLDFQMNIL
ncbi:MAG: HupE/UreJ family protein [Methylococcales bacterium]|nr:HupE/UreJ family protein [Methylococcales bacterium]